MAVYEELFIDQGANFTHTIELKTLSGDPRPLSSKHTVASKLKLSYNSDSDNTHDFTAFISDSAGGEITLSLTYLQTDALKGRKNYLYDVELTTDSDGTISVERIREGVAFVSPSVTK